MGTPVPDQRKQASIHGSAKLAQPVARTFLQPQMKVPAGPPVYRPAMGSSVQNKLSASSSALSRLKAGQPSSVAMHTVQRTASTQAPPVFRPQMSLPAGPPVYRPAMAGSIQNKLSTSSSALSRLKAGQPSSVSMNTVQRTASGQAPPVFRPQMSLPAGPPAYRPNATQKIQRKALVPAHPVSHPAPRGFNGAAQAMMARNGSVLQAALPKFAAQKELKRLLDNGGITIDDIEERRRLEGLAEAIGAQVDTTKENVTERILSDPGIAPTFRSSRIRVDDSAWGRPSGDLTEFETRVLLILKKITFFSGTKLQFLDSIRMLGLSIHEGGKIGGSSDTQSVASKRDTHVKESKGKVFVTRDFKEASGYAESGTKPLLVFVPTSTQSDLHVDPRSRTGFYAEKALPMVDQEGGVFGGGVIGTIRDELRLTGDSAETREIREAYLSLITKGALPSRQEQLGQLPELRRFWDPILDRLTDPAYGGVNPAAARIIEELNDSDQFQQLALLSRLRPMKNSSGDVVGIMGYLRGG